MKVCNEPCISVIIPSYNHENYVNIAIQSVLDQTFSDYEILIADDGSSDNSWNIIRSFKDKRITSYKFDTNIGAAETVNFLIRKASGKYIALLNSDDYWHKDKLEVQYDFMEKNPEYAVCFTDVCIVDEKGLALKYNKHTWSNMFKNSNSNRGIWLERLFFKGNSLCHPSIMIKREIYEFIGSYNPCFAQLPDYNMWIKMLKLSSIYVMHKELTFFRILSGSKNTSSITFENIQRQNLELELILDNFFDGMPDEIFIQGFSKYLKKNGDLSVEELECEKAFIYFKVDGKRKNIYRKIGIRKLYQLLSDKNMAKVLKNSYGFTHKDFRKLKNESEFCFNKLFINIKSFIKRNRFAIDLFYKIKRRKDV